jgi:hypothetical protein
VANFASAIKAAPDLLARMAAPRPVRDALRDAG